MSSRHRTVEDLMTREVVRVRLQIPFKDIAAMFAEHRITAVPVIDEHDRVVGVVSEADLLRHEAAQRDPYGRVAGALDTGRPRADGESAGQLMTAPAVTGKPYWNVVEAARVMEQHKVKRLPVVDEAGRLIGIISRSDLMGIFLRSDAAIQEEITYEVLGRILAIGPGEVQVDVTDGVATLRGRVTQPRLVPVLVRLCRGVDGVVAVHEQWEQPWRAAGPDV